MAVYDFVAHFAVMLLGCSVNNPAIILAPMHKKGKSNHEVFSEVKRNMFLANPVNFYHPNLLSHLQGQVSV
jgi:hypothetical protein